MKKVLLTLYKNRSHSLYKQFINTPPNGYEYITLDDFTNEFMFKPDKNIFFGALKKVKKNYQIIRIAKKNNVDIIYCCDGVWLFNSSIPWVLELEHVTSLLAHNFKIWRVAKLVLPFILKQKNLKCIIPWSDAGKRSLELNLQLNKNILRKIKPVRLCLDKINSYEEVNKKKVESKQFTILFIASVNYNEDREFYSKGGHILIKVMEKLKEQGEDVQLIMRSRVPKEFQYIKKYGNIIIHEDLLESNEFENIFLTADIFVFPGYQSPGMVFLDAMNFNLPIITTNVFANSEMVSNDKNGFLINFPKNSRVNYLDEIFSIKRVSFGGMSKLDKPSDSMVEKFCEKIVYLKNNSEERTNFAKYSKQKLIKEFSITSRNYKLKEIFNSIK